MNTYGFWHCKPCAVGWVGYAPCWCCDQHGEYGDIVVSTPTATVRRTEPGVPATRLEWGERVAGMAADDVLVE